MAEPVVRLMRLEGADASVPLPDFASAGAAGADLRANLAPGDRAAGLVLAPGARALVPLGFAMALPAGFEAQIRPRSGLALRDGITVLNAPGTVDADYRGPVAAILVNLGDAPATIRHGERIAQMVVAAVARPVFAVAETLDETARGAGGFGSTGRA